MVRYTWYGYEARLSDIALILILGLVIMLLVMRVDEKSGRNDQSIVPPAAT